MVGTPRAGNAHGAGVELGTPGREHRAGFYHQVKHLVSVGGEQAAAWGLIHPVPSSSHHVGASAADEMPFSPSSWGEFFAISSEQTFPTFPLTLPQLLSLCQPRLALGQLRLRASIFSSLLIPPHHATKVKPAVMHCKHSWGSITAPEPPARRTASPPGSGAMVLASLK